MACAPRVMLNSIILLIVVIFAFLQGSIHALNIGVRAKDDNNDIDGNCSRKCESMFCDAPPFLRYGKYCGLLYSGCPGEKPCDQLDTCCMKHDKCIEKMGNQYLSLKCNSNLLSCVEEHRRSGAPSFKGNTCDMNDVYKVINETIRAAIVAGKIFGKP